MQVQETIDFKFEEKYYEVSMNVYPDGLIALPDGRLLSVSKWRESYPPRTQGLKVVQAGLEKIVAATEIVYEDE